MQAQSDYEYDVFISYSDHDRDAIEDVVRLLEAAHIKPWFDKKRIPYGGLTSQIREGIDSSKFFAFFLSGNTARSQWLEYEARHFHAARGDEDPLPMILARLGDGYMPVSIAHLNPRTVHQIDFEESFLDGFVNLVRILGNPIVGILAYYPYRKAAGEELWDLLYRRASRTIHLMGHSMTNAFALNRGRKLLRPALDERGVNIKVLLLTPNDSRHLQLREVQQGLNSDINLPVKIRKTIESVKTLKQSLHDSGAASKLQVRITGKIMYASVAIFDSIALITNYSSTKDIGDDSPTFLVSDSVEDVPGLFRFYQREFDAYWQTGFHPERERRRADFDTSARILDHEEHVLRINEWATGESDDLPPPQMLVIYPTYKCAWIGRDRREKPICANCIYKNELSTREHIDFDVLTRILDQAVELGIRNIELSGGGEPLHYDYIGELLAHLEESEYRNIGVKFGLLTNGLYLKGDLARKTAKIFSYVRLSYAEGIQADEEMDEQFTRNLRDLLRIESGDFEGIRIGLKVLVSHQNARGLACKLLELKEALGEDFARLNHIRIKAMKSIQRNQFEPTKEDCNTFLDEFCDYLFIQDNWPEDIQIDLNLHRVDDNFRCMLSPLIAVVAPNGSLLACWNYVRVHDRLKIGDLNEFKLEQLWGSEQHRRVVQEIDPRNVCNADNGCACRFVEYSRILTMTDRPAKPQCPSAIDGFL